MHIPVLLNEVLEYLNPQVDENFIDATVGGGGHSLAILEKIKPNGKVLGIDQSPEAIEDLKIKIKELNLENRFILSHGNFTQISEIVKKNNFKPISGILFDLGLSSDLLEKSGRGFSFMKDEFLDMRFNPRTGELTAAEILNQWPEDKLEEVFREYGGERFARRIAKRIFEQRKKTKIVRTNQLVEIVKKALGRFFHIKSLARVFQSLRIVVNNEIKNLQTVLEKSIDILPIKGRIVVITYHSGEDRIVKNFFKQEKRIKIITKKPIIPTQQEIYKNQKARSAKLRAGEKISL